MHSPRYPVPSRKENRMLESHKSPSCGRFFTLAFLISTALVLAGCATKPDPSFRLQSPVGVPEPSHTTFNTEVVPAPGRIDVLRWVNQEVMRQMKELGYSVGEENPDLRIRISMMRTDQITTILERVDSARIRLEMRADDEVIREGATPNLTTVELDIFSRDVAAGIVAGFLEDMPEAGQ